MKHLSFIRYGSHLKPARDWFVLLTLLGLALLGLVFWSLSLYHRVENGEVLGGAPVSPQSVFDPTALKAVEHVFDDRAKEAEKYKDGTYVFADPSK